MSTPHSPADRVRPLLRVRQVREFASTPVDPDALDAIADAARWSGSSRNGQPWRFVIIRDSETLRSIHEAGLPQTRSLATAQAAIAIRNAQLFESEKEAKNERDEFLSLVTHEIKNPLTSINGYAVLGEQAVGANDNQSTLDAIKVIRGETAKILRLTEDLLDASKMTAGRFTIVRENLDLVDLVSQIARKHSATSNHKIDLHIAENVPSIEGDPVRLSQVVENLVSNAVKYSPEGSTVTIGLDSSDGLVRLRVRDEGNGIAPDKGAMIFERFYRVEEDGRMVKGTGLGLFISREIVRMHGGDITFESVIGFGTTFLVELPI